MECTTLCLMRWAITQAAGRIRDCHRSSKIFTATRLAGCHSQTDDANHKARHNKGNWGLTLSHYKWSIRLGTKFNSTANSTEIEFEEDHPRTRFHLQATGRRLCPLSCANKATGHGRLNLGRNCSTAQPLKVLTPHINY